MPKRFERLQTKHMGLAWKFQVNPSSCENPTHYEHYLRLSAINDNAEGRGTTHIFLNNDCILGFVTFRASALIRVVEEKTYGDAAMEIAELAVNKDAERQGIGSLLIDLAFAKASELNECHLGVRYITLCADASAVSFYEHFGFEPVANYGEIPREGWNMGCTPMFMKLPH